MSLLKIIANLGYGSRKDVRYLFKNGLITTVDGEALNENSSLEYLPEILVEGEKLDPVSPLTLVLNKPCGYSCSLKEPGKLVYDLLPARFRYRKPVLSCVGRLDKDTSGLLLLTDDGALLHRIISPKSAIAKTYLYILEKPLSGHEIDLFASGDLILKSDTKPLLPAILKPHTSTQGEIIISEGRYHQIRRMFAATGNHVIDLKRLKIGALELTDLESGQWKAATDQEVSSIFN